MDNSELRRTAREAFRQMDEGRQHLTIDQIAAFIKGKTPESHRAEAERHLLECAECRERREEFAAFLADSDEAPETDLEEEWRGLQRRIRRGRVIAMPRWAGIAAAVVAVCGFSYAGYRILAPTPAGLLAEAYREQRSFEFRIAGAGYAPIRQERGGASAFGQPTSLLKAQAGLAEKLKNSPEDPQTLRLKGEAEMIAGDAASAIQTLLRANDLLPQNAAILADLGSAYALLGEVDRRLENYMIAIDYLGRSIRLSRSSEAMFNCALALEKALLYDRARDQWDEYLKLDPNGEWSVEARRHREAVAAKVKLKEKAQLLDPKPEAFLAAGDSVDAEAYLREAAVNEWLLRIGSDPAAKEASRRLARMLSERHKDRWLADVLAAGFPPDTGPGLKKLAEARSLNQHGNPEAALAAAREAEQALAHGSLAAAVLWARMEETVSLRNLLRNRECLQTARRLAADLDRLPYTWLRAETHAEAEPCAFRLGDVEEAAQQTREANMAGQSAGLGEILLRTCNYDFDLTEEMGTPTQMQARAAECLRIFWSGNYPMYRYYQTVVTLRRIATAVGRQDAAVYFARSAVWSATFQQAPIYQASAHGFLAAAAAAVGEVLESDEQRILADELFDKIPGPHRFGYSLSPQMAMANAWTSRGDAQRALGILENLREGIVPDRINRDDIQYFSLLGEAHRRKGLLVPAMDEFRRSIQYGQRQVRSLLSHVERAGVIQAIDSSYRGFTAAAMAGAGGAEESLRIWREYRMLDAPARTASGDAGGTTLIFAQLPDGLAGWLVGKPKLVYHRLACSPEDANRVTSRFLRVLSDPRSSSAAIETDARQLYRWLIEPFESELTERTLVIAPDGALAAVPMQVLRSGNGEYLGDRFSVRLSPGYDTAQPAPLSAASRLLAVANPAVLGESAARFPPLPDSLREVEAARSAFPTSVLIEGREATVAALAHNVRSADIVHFAGHGYASPGNLALMLAPEEASHADYQPMRAEELEEQDWSRCRLVVLSACAAASGETKGPHNPESLVRALFKAGASRVAASLWNADSRATSELMSAFYASLAKGENPAEALDLARRKVRKTPGWDHPYYWAGFQLYGPG
jgi:CHAT domain-containing protein/tetratricopeptide (TPR) repeat protein